MLPETRDLQISCFSCSSSSNETFPVVKRIRYDVQTWFSWQQPWKHPIPRPEIDENIEYRGSRSSSNISSDRWIESDLVADRNYTCLQQSEWDERERRGSTRDRGNEVEEGKRRELKKKVWKGEKRDKAENEKCEGEDRKSELTDADPDLVTGARGYNEKQSTE